MRSWWGLAALLAIPTTTFGQFGPLQEGLALRTSGNPRTVIRRDALEFQIVTGQFKAPLAGQEVGGQKWEAVKANAEGQFQSNSLAGGYFWTTLTSPKDQVALLTGIGHGLVYVNGELRGGDPYETGQFTWPIRLREGVNTFLFTAGRGRLTARLAPAPSDPFFTPQDMTLPDVIPGAKGRLLTGITLTNPTLSPLQGLRVVAGSGRNRVETVLPSVRPLSVRKVAVEVPVTADGKVELVLSQGRKTLQTFPLALTVRKANEPYRVTFRSMIDGSVQYYAVNPSLTPGPNQALFLSLHGASVEAIGQAQAYSNKNWGHLVAPTNRRPFGFDWEDIGRLDALEVLAHAQASLATDPRRTSLTGHSMGGHGTWQLGVLFPDRFSAIAPSAGWSSFVSYGGGERIPNPPGKAEMIGRANVSSDTTAYLRNLAGLGVYVLHGDADSNVPVTEARALVQQLRSFHTDLQVWEEKGADHWWDKNPEPGADCVDWAPIFDLFSRRRIPAPSEVRQIDFITPHPGVSASRFWLTVHQQETAFVPSRVVATCSPLLRSYDVTTTNVAAFEISPVALTGEGVWKVKIDGGAEIVVGASGKPMTFVRTGGTWRASPPLSKSQKGPHRNGGFKDIFRNQVVFVIGTQTPEAAAWAEAKARYDAETFLVRGNGAVEIVTDRDFRPGDYKDRNVLLYGGPGMNSAFNQLVDRGELKAAGQPDYASFFILPRKDSDIASVAVITGSSPAGLRLTERVPLFLSGAGMPDYLVVTPSMLTSGYGGVVSLGFWDNQWR